jgi:tRNA pseudouridine55 synthase
MIEPLREITSRTNFPAGELLLLDKPYGITSFKVVKDIRYWIKKNYNIPQKLKVGHAGTLDPLATGLLIICTGRMTKKTEELQKAEKTYLGKFALGSTTPSFDLETETDQEYPVDHLNPDKLREAFRAFTGDLEQTPPVYSAVKVEGRRAYDYARQKDAVELKKKKIHISEFQLLNYEDHEAMFMVKCSKGTYIRSLARDIGSFVGSGAHLTELRRVATGPYLVNDAFTPEKLHEQIEYATRFSR